MEYVRKFFIGWLWHMYSKMEGHQYSAFSVGVFSIFCLNEAHMADFHVLRGK